MFRRGRLPVLFFLILLIHTAISLSHAVTLRPWNDEGAMASPAYDLLTHGHTGTRSWSEGLWPGIHTHTYYIMPAHFLALAAWFRIFGVGLFQMRVFSLLWGLVALVTCYILARRLTLSEGWALVAMAITACDYMVLSASSFGRMDMMSAALGLSSIAVYLSLRKRRLATALITASALNAAAVFTHPIAMAHFFGLIFVVLYFDRKSLSLRLIALAAVPFVAATALWGLYALQSPADFMAQFKGNANYSGRLAKMASPVAAVKSELRDRYLTAYGLGTHSPGHNGPIYLKALALAAYLLGLIGCFTMGAIRHNRFYRVVLVLIPIYFFVMALVDGTKGTYYLVHITPLFALALTIFCCEAARFRPRLLPVLAMVLVGTAVVQGGGILYKAHGDTYRNRYEPAVDFLKRNTSAHDLIAGSAAMTFDFGFDGTRLVDDVRMGLYGEPKPDFFVMDEIYAGQIEGWKHVNPPLAKYVEGVLHREYTPVYDYADIIIYRRIQPRGPAL